MLTGDDMGAGEPRQNGMAVVAAQRRRAAPSLQAAALRYVTDAKPGITRRRAGRGFTYR
jgi:DNA topoisomerase IB